MLLLEVELLVSKLFADSLYFDWPLCKKALHDWVPEQTHTGDAKANVRPCIYLFVYTEYSNALFAFPASIVMSLISN